MTRMGKDENEIPPYRMTLILKTAAEIADRVVNGKYLYNPSYRECEICIDLVREALAQSQIERR